MKGKQILIALTALVLLSAYLYFFGIKKKQDEQKAKDESVVIFPGLNKENITGFSFKTRSGIIAAQKTGRDWDLTEPIKAPANIDLFISLVSKFTEARAERKIDDALLADYGLNTPPVYAELIDKDGKAHTLYMSGYNPLNTLAYALKPGDNSSVYLVPKALRDECDKALLEFRHKGVARFVEDRVTKIQVNFREKKYTLEKAGEYWNLTSPVNKPAKQDRITALLNFAVNSNISGFEKKEDAAKYGLAAPADFIKIYTGAAEQAVYFGRTDADKKVIYAKSSIQSDIAYLPEAFYGNIPKLDEMINRQLVVFKQENIVKVSMKYREKSFTSEKNKPGKMPEWVFTEWVGLDRKLQNKIAMRNIINGFFWGEYKDVMENPDKNKEASEYGIVPGSAEMTLWEKDGKKAGTLIFGGKVAGSEDMYVKVSEKNTVYTVSAGVLKDVLLEDRIDAKSGTPAAR
jgi:hypothetical protein